MRGWFVDGLKAAGAGFFAGVPVKFTCGCPFGIPDVARPPRPCRKGEGALDLSETMEADYRTVGKTIIRMMEAGNDEE